MEKTISWLKEHTVAIMSIFFVAVIAVFSLLYINNSLKNDLNVQEAKIVNLEKEITEKHRKCRSDRNYYGAANIKPLCRTRYSASGI